MMERLQELTPNLQTMTLQLDSQSHRHFHQFRLPDFVSTLIVRYTGSTSDLRGVVPCVITRDSHLRSLSLHGINLIHDATESILSHYHLTHLHLEDVTFLKGYKLQSEVQPALITRLEIINCDISTTALLQLLSLIASTLQELEFEQKKSKRQAETLRCLGGDIKLKKLRKLTIRTDDGIESIELYRNSPIEELTIEGGRMRWTDLATWIDNHLLETLQKVTLAGIAYMSYEDIRDCETWSVSNGIYVQFGKDQTGVEFSNGYNHHYGALSFDDDDYGLSGDADYYRYD